MLRVLPAPLTGQCPVFTKANLDDKWLIVKKQAVCSNCLRKHHRVQDCYSPACKTCDKKHNTLLYREKVSVTNTLVDNEVAVLSTAYVGIEDYKGNILKVRVLLDTAATSSYLHEDVLKNLRLPYKRIKKTIKTVLRTQEFDLRQG